MMRLRLKFSRGEEVKFISHLDLIRAWHRALRRADIPLSYSEGFSPHPRLLVASPLAIGVTSEAELMDIYLTRPLAAATLSTRLQSELPDGLDILQLVAVGLDSPSLQAQMQFACYRVRMPAESGAAVTQAIDKLLALESLPWQHRRDTGLRTYDLRPLVADIALESFGMGIATLDMRLCSSTRGAGRPEQVSAALGLGTPLSIHRTRLVLGSA